MASAILIPVSKMPFRSIRPKPKADVPKKSKVSYFRPTPKNIERMKEMLKNGSSLMAIALELKCTTKTVQKWQKRFIAEWNCVSTAEDRRKYNKKNIQLTPTVNTLQCNQPEATEKSSELLSFEITPENMKLMKKYINEGMTVANITRELDCTEATVLEWQKQLMTQHKDSDLPENHEKHDRQLNEITNEKKVNPFRSTKKKPDLFFKPTSENIKRMKDLLYQGMVPLKVAETLNCAETTVHLWRKKFIAEWEGIALAEDKRKHIKKPVKITDEQLALAVKELKRDPSQSVEKLPEALGLKVTGKTMRKALKERANFVHSQKICRSAITEEQLALAVQELKHDPSLTAEKLPQVLGLKVTGKTMRKALKERAHFAYNRKFRKSET